MKNIFADGKTERRFRLLHLRYETGRYWREPTNNPFRQRIWYWDEPLFPLPIFTKGSSRG